MLSCSTPSSSCKLAGWNDGTDATKKASCFWHKVWVEAGRPSSGALFNIKREAKRSFKSSVRRLKRRQQYLVRDKLAKSFGSKKKDKFWSEVKRLKSAKNSSCSPVVDGISGGMNIANLFSSKFKNLLNKHPPSSRSDLLSQINSSLCESHLCEMDFSEDEVIDAIHQLKSSKSDADGVFTNHLKLACPVIAEPLALLFSTILRHGYMPPVLRDCVLVPIPKGVKDTSSSLNYRPIALSSNLSKVLERLILLKFIAFFTSSELQFGFKPGFSTTLCTGVVKNIIFSLYQ